MNPCRFYAVSLIIFAGLDAAEEICNGQTTCVDEITEAARASAMLQVAAAPSGLTSPSDEAFKACAVPILQDAHLKESQNCLPEHLQEKHLQAVRLHAHVLMEKLSLQKEVLGGVKAEKSSADPGTAPLNSTGFKDITSLCCPWQMEVFFTRLLDSKGQDVCSVPHIQGLMHWFSCVPDMDFQYVLDIIDKGNPCKFWAAKGTACPALSAACQGKYCR